MKKRKILRALVCLLVVCCLIINLSPIRAQAASIVTAALIGVAAGTVVASVMIGLGVMPAADMTAFNDLVDRCVADLPSLGVSVLDGCVNVVKILTGQKVDYTVTQGVVDAIQGWLFDNALSYESLENTNYRSYNGVKLPYFSNSTSYSKRFIVTDGTTYRFYAMRDSVRWYEENNTLFPFNDSGVNETSAGYRYSVDGDSWSLDKVMDSFTGLGLSEGWTILWSNYDILDAELAVYFPASDPSYDLLTTDVDVALGVVANPTVDVATGYDTWASGAITVPGSDIGKDDEETVLAYPLHLGQTYDETIQATQQQVWEGNSTYEDTSSGTVAGDTWADVTVTNFIGRLTNTLSSLLNSLKAGLLSGISSLFVPTAAEMEGIKDQWDTLLHDRFGAVYDAIVLIDEFVSEFKDRESVTTINFPKVTIPLLDNEEFIFGGWDVKVVPDGFDFLIQAVKKSISIICTFAFLNGLKNRYEHLLGGGG